jgi:hypothetical protein
MRPLFTVHAGEFLVGEFIERNYPELNIWIPAKDTGVDLLVTGKPGREPVSLQVKLSRDYRAPEAVDEFDHTVVAAGWLTINRVKLQASPAAWWVVVLVSHERRAKPQHIVIAPKELLKRLTATHGNAKSYHFYPWLTKEGTAMDGRGLSRADRKSLAAGNFHLGSRDLTPFVENWTCLKALA